MDKNRNNLLTRDELPAVLLVYFNVVDTNSGDVCSVDELVKRAQRLSAAK